MSSLRRCAGRLDANFSQGPLPLTRRVEDGQSSISPQVTFAMVAVIALARSDAMSAATSATSANVGSRRSRMRSSRVDVKVSSVVPAFAACRPNASRTPAASGEPADRFPYAGRVRRAGRPQADDPYTVRAQLGGERTGEPLQGGIRDAEATYLGDGEPVGGRGDYQDGTRSLPHHVPCRCPRRHKVGMHPCFEAEREVGR
jgi:hypothetical protein